MPDGNARSFYVLTPKGERGPLDRDELRDLARQHEIEPGHQVRNAFGRGLGTVAEVLGQRTTAPAARTSMSTRNAAPVPRRGPPAALIGLGVALAIIASLVIATMSRGDPAPAQPPQPAMPLPPAPTPTSAPGPTSQDKSPPTNRQHADALPGLVAEFFTLGRNPAHMPDFTSMTVISRQIESEFNLTGLATWPRTNLSENFGMRARGLLRVTKTGLHAFFLTSDDGSELLIDGKTEINNGGLHGSEEKFCSIILEPGDHDIELRFAQGSGGFACLLFWKPPGEERQLLRAPSIVHLPDRTLDP
jgi:hypothetical protein